jgi:hypothetical protein
VTALLNLGKRRHLASQPQGILERRSATRYHLSLPVTIFVPEHAEPIKGVSQNISIRGVYFTTDHEFPEDSALDLSFTLPVEITEGTEVFVRAQGRAVRVEKEAYLGRIGVAMIIEKYEFVRASHSAS